jgi:hypothetical protein
MTNAIDAANSYLDFVEAIGVGDVSRRTLDLILEIATEEEGEISDAHALIYIERLISHSDRYAEEERESK